MCCVATSHYFKIFTTLDHEVMCGILIMRFTGDE